jgi:predicted TIM-barrel fold metal-dependent hydrolase
MHIFLDKAPDVVVIWAHGGFNVPVATLKGLLDKHPMLYIELSLREGMLDDEQQLTAQWLQFLINYRHRFLVGMDTYKPSRWADLPEIAAETRHWLEQLPEEVAVDIARNNLDRLFPQ